MRRSEATQCAPTGLRGRLTAARRNADAVLWHANGQIVTNQRGREDAGSDAMLS